MKRYLWLFAASVLILVLALQYRAWVGLVSKFSSGRSAFENIPVVKVASVKKVTIPIEIIASGELEAVREANAVTQVSGVLDQLRVKLGDRVAEGQVVATFKVREAQQRTEQIETLIAEAQARVREKDARVAEGEKQIEKLRDLRRRDLIAANDVSGAESKVETARAERELAKAQLDQQQAALAQLRYLLKAPRVVAPLTGVVTEIFAEAGGYVQSTWPILSVAATDPLKVVIRVPEHEGSSLRKGSNATVTPQDNKPDGAVTGQITGLDRSRAAKDAIILVEIQLPNRQRQLSLATAVSVALKLDGQREALLIPRQALVEIEDKSIVYVVVKDRVQTGQVLTRPYRDGMIEVLEGLNENQQLVIDDPGRLKPDSKIRVDAKNPEP